MNNLEQGKEPLLIDIAQYWRTIKRYKWSIGGITLAALVLGIVIAVKTTPIYSAKVTLQADPTPPSNTLQDNYIQSSLVYLFYETQYGIIRSRAVAESVVDKLDLVQRHKDRLSQQGEVTTQSLLDSAKASLLHLFGEPPRQEAIDTDAVIRSKIADGIGNNLNVQGSKKSQIITLSYESEDPALAADIINALAESYISFDLEARLQQIKSTSTWLAEQSAELKSKVQEAEERLQAYQDSQGMIDTTQQQSMAAAKLVSLNSELIKAQSKQSQAEELYQQARLLGQQPDSYSSLGPVLQNQTVKELVKEEAKQERKVEELFERYGEKHPKMIAARSDLASTQESLRQEVAKIVSNIETEYRLATTQVRNINNLLNNTKSDMQSLRGSNLELLRLEREVENSRRLYEAFVNRSMEADVSGDYKGSNVRIIDKARVPAFPIKPQMKKIVFIALIGGIFLGVIYAFARESMENNFQTMASIEEKVGIPALGFVPLVKSTKAEVKPELHYLAKTRTPFAEAINTIRTGLIFSNLDQPPQTILVTSSSAEEGKSTLSINLAASFSQLDETLLIELDLRKPTLARNLSFAPGKGLCNLLAGDMTIEEAIVAQEGQESLKVLPCGQVPLNPMELLSSNKFEQLLMQLKERYRRIIIDSPPILPVSDSCILGKLSDAVVMAVKAEETKVGSVVETINRLNKVNVLITGAVLTQASPLKMSYYGDHYYANSYYGEVGATA